MNNSEFLASLAHKSGLQLDKVQALTDATVACITKQLSAGETVQCDNLGTFEIQKCDERVMINPVSKQKMLVPPKLVINFIAD